MLEEIDDPNLVVLNVWVPMLPSDAESSTRRSSLLLPDARVQHFWLDRQDLGRAFQQALDLPRVAWDIYFVYAPGVRWDGEPPQPTFFMHQLSGLPEETLLDGDVLARHVRRILGGGRTE